MQVIIRIFFIILALLAVRNDGFRSIGRDNHVWCDTHLQSTREEISKLTVPKIKERLKELNLPVSGLKAELIERLTGRGGAESAPAPAPAVAVAVVKPATAIMTEAVSKSTSIPVPVLAPVPVRAWVKKDALIAAAPTPSHVSSSISSSSARGEEIELDELEMLMMEGEKVMREKNIVLDDEGSSSRSSSSSSRSSSSSSTSSSGTRSDGSRPAFSHEPRVDTSDGQASSALLPEIERLLRARGDARAARDFDKADDIREQLLSQFEVSLYDRDGRWQGRDGSTGFYPALIKVAKPMQVATTMSKAELQALVDQRTQARRARNFALADEIRDKLGDCGVELFDAMNTWQTVDGKHEGVQSTDSYAGSRQAADDMF